MHSDRLYGTIPTLETRSQSHEEIKPKKQVRYNQILEILSQSKGPMSAKDISMRMFNLGYTLNSDRNNSSPRLTELMQRGLVEQVGKKVCSYTGKTVTIFQIRSGDD